MEETANPYEAITKTQREWAQGLGIELDRRGWATRFQDNLLQSLGSETLAELVLGGEITEDGRGGRIAAPHSSTALACNTFDWWRGGDLSTLGAALTVDVDRISGFEQKHSTDLVRSPQLDVQLLTPSNVAVGVEVKLREPYGKIENQFGERYFQKEGLWNGLDNLRSLATDISSGSIHFSTLHAAQLIKHALGLNRSFDGSFILLYLWHFVPSEVGTRHLDELARFEEIADLDIRFVPVTVAELLGRFRPDASSAPWHDYMVNRYVTPAGP